MQSLIARFDSFVFSLCDALRSPFLTDSMVFITRLGDNGYFWITLALVLCCFQKTRRTGLLMLSALAATYVVSTIGLKNLFARIRPCIAEPQNAVFPCPSGYSFPSGHSVSSFAAAFSLFFKHEKHALCAVFLACLIAFSRIYLHVHYATDVLAGAFIGASTAYFLAKIRYFKNA